MVFRDEKTKLWMPWCIPLQTWNGSAGAAVWMHIFRSSGGCMGCQAQDCCVGSCSTGSNVTKLSVV